MNDKKIIEDNNNGGLEDISDDPPCPICYAKDACPFFNPNNTECENKDWLLQYQENDSIRG